MTSPIQVVTMTDDQLRALLNEAAEMGATLALKRSQSAANGEAWDIARCCRELGIRETKLRSLVASGNIPHFRAGNRIRFWPQEIRTWQGTQWSASGGERRMGEELEGRRKNRKAR